MSQKLSHIWEYYKLPIAITLVVIYIVFSLSYRFFHREEIGLYIGFVNVVPGDKVHSELVEQYASCNIYTYENLLLTENITDNTFTYVQASEVKILGAIEDKKLDIVIMDEEALKAFTDNEYLYDLHSIVTDDSLLSCLEGNLQTDYAINLSNYATIKNAGFPSDIYLGVIANSTRLDEINQYLKDIIILQDF